MVRTGMAAFCCGAMIITVLPALPSWQPVLWAAMQLIVLAVGLIHICQRLVLIRITVMLACLLIGVAWHAQHGQYLLEQRLPSHLEGRDQWVRGRVVSLPEPGERQQQFRFRIEASEYGWNQRTVLLNDYDGRAIALGQRWQLLVRLNRPHGHANPGGFDYEAWLFQQRISARGYVRNDPSNRELAATGRSVIADVRATLQQRVLQRQHGLRHDELILALMLGDRSRIDLAAWEILTLTGTNHLLVVSGLHVGFVAGLCYGLGLQLWRLLPRVPLFLAAQQVGALLAMSGALFYSLLAGFSMPTQRALVMVCVVSLARFHQLRVLPSAGFLAALCLVLMLDPMAAINAGFWLSFVAVASLLLVFAPQPNSLSMSRLQTWWQAWGSSQWVVFIALVVPLSAFMGQFPLLAPLANVFAIPLVSLVIVPLCLISGLLLWCLPEMAQWPLLAADALLELLWLMLVQLASQSWLPPPQQVTRVTAVAITLGSLGCLIGLLPLPRAYRVLVLPLLLPLLAPRTPEPNNDALELHVLDVGQGLSVVLRSGGRVLVYDTGPSFDGGFDAGAAVLVPVLRSLGVTQVDVLILSHGDRDHTGGTAGLLAAVPVNLRYWGEPVAGLPDDFRPCLAGQGWRWEAVVFTFVYPIRTNTTGNDSSCVLHIRLGEHQILLPGDIESAAEMELLLSSTQPQADIVVAPHHGSRTSSSAAWVRRVQPNYVVFAAGYRNRFNHPAPDVVARYLRQGSQLLATDRDGMISFYLVQGQPLAQPRYFRRDHPRYWH